MVLATNFCTNCRSHMFSWFSKSPQYTQYWCVQREFSFRSAERVSFSTTWRKAHFCGQSFFCTNGSTLTLDLVRPQTFSHTVMFKVCLTASNTLFDADAFVRLNYWILSNIWRVILVFSCIASLNSPNIFSLTHNTIYSPFT